MNKTNEDLKEKEIVIEEKTSLKQIDNTNNLNIGLNNQTTKGSNIAFYLFVLFAVSFIGLLFADKQFHLLKEYPFLHYIKAFIEAGLVGALADWFAVVAIFQKPFGLNIPHTNLIVKNKEKMAVGISDFVVEHFLNKEKVLATYNSPTIQKRLHKFLLNKNTETLIVDYLKQLDLFNTLKKQLEEKLSGEKIALKLQEELHKARKNYLSTIFTLQVKSFKQTLNKEDTKKLIEDKIKAFSESKNEEGKLDFFDRVKTSLKRDVVNLAEPKITQHIIDSANGFIDKTLADVDNSFVYQKLDSEIVKWIDTILTNPIIHKKIEEKRDCFTEEDFYNFIVKKYSQAVRNKDNLITLNNLVANLISIIVSKKDYFHSYIKQTVLSWNEEELSKNIESNVYNDLQYIRINGTLVGGLIGVLLYGLSELVSLF